MSGRLFGVEDQRALIVRGGLGLLYSSIGRVDEAEGLLETYVAVVRTR